MEKHAIALLSQSRSPPDQNQRMMRKSKHSSSRSKTPLLVALRRNLTPPLMDLLRANHSLDSLLAEIYEQEITADKLNSAAFINSVVAMRKGVAELYRNGIGQKRALDRSTETFWDIPLTIDECFQQLMENLPIPDRDDVKTALDTFIAQLKQDFQEHVDQEVVRWQREIVKHMKELGGLEVRRLRERLDAARNQITGNPSLLTAEDFKLIRGCLHPDRHPAEEQDRYNRAFHLCLWYRGYRRTEA